MSHPIILSSLDEYESLFAAIRSEQDRQKLVRQFTHLFKVYAVISLEIKRGNVFWRGRKIESKPFFNATKMSYPPAKNTPHGRLNDAHSPMLYAATDEETVLHELEVKEGDLVQFIGFRVKNEQSLRLAVIGELHHVSKTGYTKTFGQDPKNVFTALLNKGGMEAGKRLMYADAFLASLLADDRASERSYLITRSLGQVALENSEADGFFYPSVRDSLGMNIVIRPTQFDLAAHVVRSHIVRVIKVREFGFIDYEILEEAEEMDEKGGFKWVKPIAKNIARFFNLTKKEYDFMQVQSAITKRKLNSRNAQNLCHRLVISTPPLGLQRKPLGV